MTFELLPLGVGVGILSGFFGVGGGTILVPILLMVGFAMKEAVGISVVQMVFSSVYGSYLNLKRGTLDMRMVVAIGVGGFAGALLSSKIVAGADAIVLEVLFLGFVFTALARLWFNPKEQAGQKAVHPAILFVIGFVLGMFSISIGVGGSILLVPILVGFLHVPIKPAISAGLFFVVFSSLSGLLSLGFGGQIDYVSGTIVGIASLVGVGIGIALKHRTTDRLQKRLLITFYLFVATYLIYRLVVEHG